MPANIDDAQSLLTVEIVFLSDSERLRAIESSCVLVGAVYAVALLVTVPAVALPMVFAVTKLAVVVATATIIAVAILEVTVLAVVTEAVLESRRA